MRLRLPRPRGAVLDARCHQSSQRTKKSDRLFAFAFDRRSAAAISAPSQYFLRRLAPAFADRIDGGTCLRSTSRYRRTLSARHDRCSSASGRPCRLAGGPGVCGGIPTTSEADSCCQAVEGCTTVECEKAAPQPAQAGLQRENSCVNHLGSDPLCRQHKEARPVCRHGRAHLQTSARSSGRRTV
jgi:hypothetical protein